MKMITSILMLSLAIPLWIFIYIGIVLLSPIIAAYHTMQIVKGVFDE